MKDIPEIGKLITNGEKRRDAIHVAVAPVTAHRCMSPGDRIGFVGDSRELVSDLVSQPIGIADPFLNDDIQEGQRFWMFLFPNTIESLRHVWTHPSFRGKGAE